MRINIEKYRSYYRAEFTSDNTKVIAIGYSATNAHRNLMLKLNSKQYK